MSEAAFSSSLEHLLAELERIDLLIRARVWRARQASPGDDLRAFYIPETEIDSLLTQPAGLPAWAREPGPPAWPEVRAALDQLTATLARRVAQNARLGPPLRLATLTRLFDLTSGDVDILLIGLAPELDLRYERLYAYLQDDVTKKRPSVDLALNLLSPTFADKLARRGRLGLAAPVRRHHLVQLCDDPTQVQPPLLSRYIRVDERIVSYLLEADDLDPRLEPYVQACTPQACLADLLLPDDVKRRLACLAAEENPGSGPIFYFQGPDGVGKQTTAEALCRERRCGLLVVDGAALAAEDKHFPATLGLILREARLCDAALYWAGFDALLDDDQGSRRQSLWRALADRPGLTFLAGEAAWEPGDTSGERAFLRVEFPRPTAAERLGLWARSLNGHRLPGPNLDLDELAAKFRLSGGQIGAAAATARNLARWRDPAQPHVDLTDLYAACRLQSNRKLGSLARKITPHYTWADIILPADRLEQLREICDHVRYRAQVYDEWGFDRKLALGRGLNILFAGPSGTGKTMAAEIIAGELGLDLYKIDLATVVSKYIGETEKNLARIFAEAETSNAILFFDEADALFGKRSEVRDAHDRYANVEIAYLLQKMDEYEGIVVLATNLRKNMDEAFVRRMHFAVEFPLPSEADRRRIWEQIWPAGAPRGPGLDLDRLAARFELTGGNIRNIALSAAFLAARAGEAVDLGHILRAARREYQKMGKVMAEKEFEVAYARP